MPVTESEYLAGGQATILAGASAACTLAAILADVTLIVIEN